MRRGTGTLMRGPEQGAGSFLIQNGGGVDNMGGAWAWFWG